MLSRKGFQCFRISKKLSKHIGYPKKASSLRIWSIDVSRNGSPNKKSLMKKEMNIIRIEEITTRKWCGRLPKNVSIKMYRSLTVIFKKFCNCSCRKVTLRKTRCSWSILSGIGLAVHRASPILDFYTKAIRELFLVS